MSLLAPLLALVFVRGSAASLDQSIGAYLKPWSDAHLLSGTVLVAKGDLPVFEHSYGMADYENSVPNRNDSRYCVASVTKWMTLIVVLQMLVDKQIALGDPLEKYLEGIPNGDKITLLQLISHRSGMPHEFFGDESPSAPFSAAEMAEIAKTTAASAQPGEKEIYSSAGFTLLARVVEIVKKKPFQDVLKEQIFDRCGMKNTIDPAPFELIPHRSFSYMPTPTGCWRTPDVDYTHLVGAGSVFGTAHDLLLMLRAMVHDQFGKTVTANLLSKPVSYENGLSEGYRSYIWYDRASDASLIFCGNTLTPAADRMLADIPKILAGKKAAKTVTVVPAPSPFKGLEELAGEYRVSLDGSIVKLRYRNGMLAFANSVLVPVAQDRLFGMRDGGDVRVVRNPSGSVDRLDWMDNGATIVSFEKVQAPPQ